MILPLSYKLHYSSDACSTLCVHIYIHTHSLIISWTDHLQDLISLSIRPFFAPHVPSPGSLISIPRQEPPAAPLSWGGPGPPGCSNLGGCPSITTAPRHLLCPVPWPTAAMAPRLWHKPVPPCARPSAVVRGWATGTTLPLHTVGISHRNNNRGVPQDKATSSLPQEPPHGVAAGRADPRPASGVAAKEVFFKSGRNCRV